MDTEYSNATSPPMSSAAGLEDDSTDFLSSDDANEAQDQIRHVRMSLLETTDPTT